jgi:hypothetical protein
VLRYNSLDSVRCTPDCPVCQRSNDYFARNGRLQPHSMRYSVRQSQSTRSWCTEQSTGLVRCTTGQSRGPTSQSSNGRTPTTGWRGWRTGQCSVAHRTVRCAMRQHTSNDQPTFNGIQVSTLLHLTRAIAFNTRHTKEIKSSPNSTQSFSH